MSRPLLAITLVGLVALVCPARAADPLRFAAQPLFEGYEPTGGSFPLAIDIANDGADARGAVVLTGDQFKMTYPVDLPRGARKRLVTYPIINYGGVHISLETSQGRAEKDYNQRGMMSEQTVPILLISDNSGELGFLRQHFANKGKEVATYRDIYGRPQEAPDRAVAYQNVGCVVLGTGAERISTGAVEALKLFTLTGGTVVFLGGASSPILADPRWQGFAPVSGGTAKTLSDSDLLRRFGPPPRSFTVMEPRILPGATKRGDRSATYAVSRGFGLGRAVFLTINPTEAPFSRWPGIQPLFLSLVRPTESRMTRGYLQNFSGEPETALGATPATARPMEDPFSTKLPPVEAIAQILALYFIMVVPVNFLVLKKLKRGELAWVTSPIISLIFAGLLFQSARSLYSAQMSSATRGLLVMNQGTDLGMFVGTSQIFVPRAGGYDLKLSGVDSIGMIQDRQEYGFRYGRDLELASLDPVDLGTEILVPSMPVNNLAFRRLTYRQRLGSGNWFSIEQSRGSSGKIRCRVTNNSPYDLDNPGLALGTNQVAIAHLKSGESVMAEGQYERNEASDTPGITANSVAVRQSSVILTGSLKGLRPGPQIGAEVLGRTAIQLTFSAPLEVNP